MNPIEEFNKERQENILGLSEDKDLKKLSLDWLKDIGRHKYVYNFNWLGRPIIQLPTDVFALQELIWEVKPDLIIETGIAHGGSIIFSASMLELIGGDGIVAGIDIDIREHNRLEIEKHPMFNRITMIEGSSIDIAVIRKVRELAADKKRVMIFLDSCHTHEHVLKELELYSEFVTLGSYIVVFDTIIDFVPASKNIRPWGVGNNPWTAVQEFIKNNRQFTIDKTIPDKLLLTAAVDGFLKRVI